MSIDVDSQTSIPAAFLNLADSCSDQIFYSQAEVSNVEGPRAWVEATFGEAKERVLKLVRHLRELGVEKGTKVAVLSQSRPEWVEADLAVTMLGGVTISVYQSLLAEDIGYILFDSGAEIVFAENREQVDKLKELMDAPCEIPATEERAASTEQVSIRSIISFEKVEGCELSTSFSEILAGDAAEVPAIVSELTRDDLASFVYTSGTTGPPKGVMQTHGNHLSNVRQARTAKIVSDGQSLMVFLPLAHSFAKLEAMLGAASGIHLKFPGIPDKESSKMVPASVTRDIREGSASVVPIVPRLLEKMQAGIVAKSKGKGIGPAIVRATLWSSKQVYIAAKEKRSGTIVEQMVYQGTGGIRSKISAQLFGPDFEYCISGGAKLNVETAEFFDQIGVDIQEGYGLTETCVATNVNPRGAIKIGTVGPVLDHDIELRLGEENEILFRGPNISLGYYGRDQATKESWDEDGWFYTGDLGDIDEDGYLSIVGRKKDIIVTSYGKNIAPDEIEGSIKGSEFVSQAVMVGDGRAYCAALLTLEPVAVERWYNENRQDVPADPSEDDNLHAAVWKDVEAVNADLASYEQIKKIAILPEDFTVENGMLTPTFKVKKKIVYKKFADVIEGLY